MTKTKGGKVTITGQTLRASFVEGDQRVGCACAYMWGLEKDLDPPAVGRNRRQKGKKATDNVVFFSYKKKSQSGVFDDVFISGTGQKKRVPLCQKLLVSPPDAGNTLTKSLEWVHTPMWRRVASRCLCDVKRAVFWFLELLRPRIQFGVGVNLFRLNGG